MHGRQGRKTVRTSCCCGTIWFAIFAILAVTMWSDNAVAAEIYDFSSGAGTTAMAFKYRVPTTKIPPLTNTTPFAEFSMTDYAAIASSDDASFDTGSVGESSLAANRYVFQIEEPASSVTSLAVQWEGRTSGGAGTINVYVWNYAAGGYEQFGTTTSESDVGLSQTFASNALSSPSS